MVPSLTKEGFGLVAAEVAASGGLVLASDHSGLAEVVVDKIGFVADGTKPEKWAEIIQKINGWLSPQRAAFISSSMPLAQQHYSWDRVARETVAAY